MNDDAALKFEVPARFCGLKSRFHFTPKLTLLSGCPPKSGPASLGSPVKSPLFFGGEKDLMRND